MMIIVKMIVLSIAIFFTLLNIYISRLKAMPKLGNIIFQTFFIALSIYLFFYVE